LFLVVGQLAVLRCRKHDFQDTVREVFGDEIAKSIFLFSSFLGIEIVGRIEGLIILRGVELGLPELTSLLKVVPFFLPLCF
jgi:hypothetical protein